LFAHRVVVIDDATFSLCLLENEDVEQGLEDEEGTVKTARIIAINVVLLLLLLSFSFSLSLSLRAWCVRRLYLKSFKAKVSLKGGQYMFRVL
tara:strand:- start:81 stop:356 length:276 start_codon:yes stop_codon:yes gene_type:complete